MNYFKKYVKELFDIYSRGDAREESFYATLREFLKQFAQDKGKEGIKITILPKKTEAGNPDFQIWDGRNKLIGYIEAKFPASNLDKIEESSQLLRYREVYHNLILTDFFEFRLYRYGKLIDKALLARPYLMSKLGGVPPLEDIKGVESLLTKFFSFALPAFITPEKLAEELAKKTRFLKTQILLERLKDKKSKLYDFYKAFEKYLLPSLSVDDFADFFAQTISYALFAARIRTHNSFTRQTAYHAIPRNLGVLREIFRYISASDIESEELQFRVRVDDMVSLLAEADINSMTKHMVQRGKLDLIYHFYEPFLATYDPERRERLGVYYTPEQVVRYIVRSVDYLLREKFHKSDGLADYSVKILDPAAGTMTFIGEAIRSATASFVSKWGEGSKRQFIEDHILEDFYAFEYLMAPYVIGHLKIGLELEELGYELPENRRFKFYLTNTLTMEELEASNIPLLREMTEEARSAQKVKSKETPILVVLGNPPYSVSSSNKSEWIENLMETYKSAVRGERNIQPLSDDYIKFIRFAHWKIVQTGHGIVGFITNNSYLSGLIHRGMRKALLDDFDEIYILDLHGNARMGERAPDGSPDENVFDIMQGVAIALFVRRPDHDEKPAKVFYHSLFGRREEKYDFLNSHDVSNTPWEELKPFEPYYFFVPKDFSLAAEYEKFWSVAEIFPVNSISITTSRDKFVIDFDKNALRQRISVFRDLRKSDEEIRILYGLRDTSYFKLPQARQKVAQDEDWELKIISILYRPFDVRWIFYHTAVIERNRYRVMRHMLVEENLGLLTNRQIRASQIAHSLATNLIADSHVFETMHASLYLFPLYLYHIPDEKKLALHGEGERKPNLNPEFIRQIEQIVGKTTPEKIFYYIYAVLYCPTYRERYQEFLRIDFPKIPLPPGAEAFEKFAEIGHKLVELHLLRAPELSNPVAKFHGEGDCVVQKIKYDPQKRRVWINKTQYFSPVEPEWWEYHIGGYQVLEKWLKDRKRRRLSLEESQTYCKIITAIEKTIELQGRLREIYRRLE